MALAEICGFKDTFQHNNFSQEQLYKNVLLNSANFEQNMMLAAPPFQKVVIIGYTICASHYCYS